MAAPVTSVAMLAPAILAQMLIFLASLYFFVATRDHIRISVLSLCVSRRMRWRTAHVFRDVEHKVSRFLLSITLINLVRRHGGVAGHVGHRHAVADALGRAGGGAQLHPLCGAGGDGRRSCWRWAWARRPGCENILLPVGCYVGDQFRRGQIVTPHFIGRTMTLNPFMIFLSITFWLWAWGPVGGLVAVPSLLIAHSILIHALPGKPIEPSRPVRRTRNMTDRGRIAGQCRQGDPRAGRGRRSRPTASRKDERCSRPREPSPSGVRTAHCEGLTCSQQRLTAAAANRNTCGIKWFGEARGGSKL